MTALRYTFVALASIILTVLVVYLTPLHYLNIKEPAVKDINATDFYTDYKVHPEKYVFVDVRTQSEYAKGHAVGAQNITIPALFDGYVQLPKTGKEIILICAGGKESGVAYGYLEHHGFLNLRRIDGGTKQWVVEGLPIETGLGTSTH